MTDTGGGAAVAVGSGCVSDRATAPAGASSASVSKAGGGRSRTFSVRKGLPLLAIEVPGKGPSGAPVLKISGPLGSFTTDALKARPLEGDGAEGQHDDTRVLVAQAKPRGSLKLTPPAPGVRRVRALILRGGGLRETIPLATYGGPGAPNGLSVKRAKKGLTVSWHAACGISSYRVSVGKGKPQTVKGTSTT